MLTRSIGRKVTLFGNATEAPNILGIVLPIIFNLMEA